MNKFYIEYNGPRNKRSPGYWLFDLGIYKQPGCFAVLVGFWEIGYDRWKLER